MNKKTHSWVLYINGMNRFRRFLMPKVWHLLFAWVFGGVGKSWEGVQRHGEVPRRQASGNAWRCLGDRPLEVERRNASELQPKLRSFPIRDRKDWLHWQLAEASQRRGTNKLSGIPQTARHGRSTTGWSSSSRCCCGPRPWGVSNDGQWEPATFLHKGINKANHVDPSRSMADCGGKAGIDWLSSPPGRVDKYLLFDCWMCWVMHTYVWNKMYIYIP